MNRNKTIAVLGATGQIGSMLASELLKRGEKVRAVVRNVKKAQELKNKGAEVFVADYTNTSALITAFQNCRAVFLITPENPFSEECISDMDKMLTCFYEAVISAGIKEVIGLSSMGAQHESGTGNLTVSYKLEHLFCETNIISTYIRLAYYFSNWIGYCDTVKESGILPSFRF